MVFPSFDHFELKRKRESYAYPAVGIEASPGFSPLHFGCTAMLDSYHHDLLRSGSTDAVILGYLSVIFWGHYSGQDGRLREERALGKVSLANEGRNFTRSGATKRIRGVRDFGRANVATTVGKAAESLDEGDFELALSHLMMLPGLQIAFASKVCAFLAPEKCGVIDTVIAMRHPEMAFEFSRSSGSERRYVKSTIANRKRYGSYCHWLQQQASALNADSEHAKWTDRDGVLHPWRALDVERAMY